MAAEQHTTRRALLGAARAIPFMAVIPAVALATPDPWAKFKADNHLLADALADVIPVAAKRGYHPDDISVISLVNAESPTMAPALHFGQPNGDTDIVMEHGVIVRYGRGGHTAEDAAWNSLFGMMDQLDPRGRDAVRQARLAGYAPGQLTVICINGAFAKDGPVLQFQTGPARFVAVDADGVRS